MRRLLPLALAAAALLAVAALAGVARPEEARGELATPDTVTTTGHGIVTVVPDRATITAGVHTQAASATEQSAGAPVPVFDAAVAKSGATPVEPGTQDVAADVTVTFRIR